jgi:hypothetical protein
LLFVFIIVINTQSTLKYQGFIETSIFANN